MFLSDNIDLGKPDNYILSIRLKPDGFSFLISDIYDKDSYCYRETTFPNDANLLQNIQRIVFDYNFLTESFKKTYVVCLSETYDLIPEEFYKSLNLKEIYNFSRTNKQEYLFTDSANLNGVKLIFSLPNDLYLFLNRSLYIPQFRHVCGLYSEYFSKKTTEESVNSLSVYFDNEYVHIICMNKEKKVISVQSYYKEHSQNILFFILSIWEKLKFDQMNDFLYLYGYPPGVNPENILKEYINNVKNNGMFEQITDFGAKSQEIPLDLLLLTR